MSVTTKPTISTKKVTPFPADLSTALRDLNECVCYIESTSEIARIEPSKLRKRTIPTMSCAAFTNEAFRNVKIGKTYVAREWMDWKDRRTASEIVYRPGEPRFTAEGELNSWFPSTSKPKKGDISLFHEYMAGLMENAPQYLDWLTVWLAYHLQRPTQKILSGVLCWSFEQGNGKSTLGGIMRRVYGLHNSALIRNRFPERFNSYAENIQFLWADELMPVRNHNQQDMIKSMITQPTVTIEHKGKKPYDVPDIASYYFTSNHPNAFDLKPEDRRFFIHNVGRNSLTLKWWKQTFWPWLEQQSSIDAIHHYLLHEVDITQPVIGGDPESLTPAVFNPSAWAPRTDARRQMIDDNRDDIEAWLGELKENPIAILGESSASRTIFTSEELFALYREQSKDTKSTAQTFRLRMAHSMYKLCAGNPVRLDDSRPRLYSVDPEKAKLDMAQVKLCWAQEHE